MLKKIDRTPLAEAVVSFRKTRGMTQLDLSKHLGVPQSAIAQWERNIYKPPAPILLKFSELVPEEERQWWRDQAAQRTGIDWRELNTPGAVAPPDVQRRVPLIKKGKETGDLKKQHPDEIERELQFPSEWFPEGGATYAVHLHGKTSSNLIAIIDVSRDDAKKLMGRMIAVRTRAGIEVCWLTRENGLDMLTPMQPGMAAMPRLLSKEQSSIVGLVRWMGDAPSTAKKVRA